VAAEGFFRRQLQVRVETRDDVAPLHRAAEIDPFVLEAARIDHPDFPAGITLKNVVELQFQPRAARLALFLEGAQVLVADRGGGIVGIVATHHKAQRVRRHASVGVVTRALGQDLHRAVHRELFDEAGVFLLRDVVLQREGQEQVAAEVALDVARADHIVPSGDDVHLVHVALHHRLTGLDLHIVALHDDSALAIVAHPFQVLPAKFLAKLVQIHDGRKERTVAHQEASVAVADVAARAGDQDAPVVLALLLLHHPRVVENLHLEETGQQDEKQHDEHPRHDEHARTDGNKGIGVVVLGSSHR